MPLPRKHHKGRTYMKRPALNHPVRILSLIVFALALVSMCGHMSGHHYLFDWGAEVGMAVSTAVCFMCLSLGMFILTVHYDK
jgi:hypothetical protein